MFGSGVLKGMGVTLKEFLNTYVDDLKRIPSRYAGGREEIDQSDAVGQSGLFTIQYPEEHRKQPERFRNIPMLIYNAETGEDRCTACGICAKVCPPQCIWIVRDKDENGKPITRPAEFYIDTTICMNCGLCAEFCPFDAIKMNQDFEIAAYKRMPELVFDLKELRVPTTYYARVHPTDWAEEEAARAAKEAEKAAKVEKPAATPVNTEAQAGTRTEGAVRPQRTPEEIERLKADAAARRAAQATGTSAVPPATDAGASVKAGAQIEANPEVAPRAPRTPEEIERLKAEAAARRAAKAAEDAKSE
jgi:NADH-quinone oxidoreductase subunit I